MTSEKTCGDSSTKRHFDELELPLRITTWLSLDLEFAADNRTAGFLHSCLLSDFFNELAQSFWTLAVNANTSRRIGP
jgi:hypothetical protein